MWREWGKKLKASRMLYALLQRVLRAGGRTSEARGGASISLVTVRGVGPRVGGRHRGGGLWLVGVRLEGLGLDGGLEGGLEGCPLPLGLREFLEEVADKLALHGLVVVSVAAHLLNLGADAHADGDVDQEEQDEAQADGPPEDGRNPQQLRPELPPVGDGGEVVASAVGALEVALRCEDAGGDNAPDAAGAVHGPGVEGVVDLEAEEQLGGEVEQSATDGSDQKRRPLVDDRAPGGDGDEPSQDAVQSRLHDPVPFLDPRDDSRNRTSRSSGQGSGHRHLARILTVPRESRSAVEAVPAEPEDEHTEGGDTPTLARHRQRLAVLDAPGVDEVAAHVGLLLGLLLLLLTILLRLGFFILLRLGLDDLTVLVKLLEPTLARADDPRAAETRPAADRVHNPGAGVVDHAVGVHPVGRRREGREPALA
eukprot:Hpha_TRINITY_DN16654_c0_g4::TRINITY_DN16654_c0_g4_i1::g.183214::m.183214